MNKPKIVILGAGFGGIYTYLHLRKKLKPSEADIILVNKTNHFLFTPMLHEVATGGLGHHQIVESLREIIYDSDTNLYVANIESVDFDAKKVHTNVGDINFDYLVIATGATTNFYNIPGAKENAFTIKSLGEAIKLRNYFIDNFEKASKVKDAKERKKLLSFAIVGGGATGVEVAGEASDFFYKTFCKYYCQDIEAGDVNLYIINRGPELLPQFNPYLRKKALKALTKKKVQIKLNSSVTSIEKDHIQLSSGETLPVNNVIWTAGVKANPPKINQEIPTDSSGRLKVNQHLQIKGHPHIFALGDVASYEHQSGKALPMLAQVAVQQSKTVANNIAASIQQKPLKSFKYHSKGELVSIGQWGALGHTLGVNWSGPIAWWLWRTVYLFKFISSSKKIKIAIDWTVNLFHHRDITRA
ncbi:NAD(P)/FAD-dependent oxidoreductase [Candidatus Peregrinibacteria bacterium]|nr:NAD(P)/FAD-dependent oxidoreductase [Candidatus Peregrinibacteria bacterium]